MCKFVSLAFFFDVKCESGKGVGSKGDESKNLEGGGGLNRSLGTPLGGKRREEYIHLTRLMTPEGSADFSRASIHEQITFVRETNIEMSFVYNEKKHRKASSR